jgi:hypothetical protein
MDSSVEEAVGFALQREIFAFPTRVMQRAADWKIKASGKTFIILPSVGPIRRRDRFLVGNIEIQCQDFP